MDDLVVNARLTIPARCMSWSASRSSGPGGQHVNKTNSRVTLKFDTRQCPGLGIGWRMRLATQFGSRMDDDDVMTLHSETHREQPRNLADARERLVAMVAACEHPPKKRRPTRPTKGSKRRRIEAKKRTGEKKRSRGTKYRPE